MWLSVSLGILVVVILFYILEKLFRKPRVQNVGTKSVFITGTDTGFGHQLALHLDSKGVKVYAGCYTEEGADILTKNASSRLKIIKLDVTKMDSILRAKKEIQESIQPGEGNLRILIYVSKNCNDCIE